MSSINHQEYRVILEEGVIMASNSYLRGESYRGFKVKFGGDLLGRRQSEVTAETLRTHFRKKSRKGGVRLTLGETH